MINKPVIVLGAGGHSQVLVDALRTLAIEIIGITDPDNNLHGKDILGIPVIGDDEIILKYNNNKIMLVNGLGVVNRTNKRREVYETFKQKGYLFRSVIYPQSIVSPSVALGEGVQVMAGAVVQAASFIGTNSIVNTGACIDHDCIIGQHVHIAPGVTISGGVSINDGVLIGAGSTVIQGINIGANSIVAAGAVVINDVYPNSIVMGVPAREANK